MSPRAITFSLLSAPNFFFNLNTIPPPSASVRFNEKESKNKEPLSPTLGESFQINNLRAAKMKFNDRRVGNK